MLLIKRTKNPPPGNEPPGPPAVHYAKTIAPAGNVVGWVSARDEAIAVSEEVAEKVLGYYEGRENAGRLDLEPERLLALPVTPDLLPALPAASETSVSPVLKEQLPVEAAGETGTTDVERDARIVEGGTETPGAKKARTKRASVED